MRPGRQILEAACSSRRSALVRAFIGSCVFALCGAGMIHASAAAPSPAKPPSQAATPVKVKATPKPGRAEQALSAAQDRAVANYQRNQSRKAAAAKLAQTRATAANAVAAIKAKGEAAALARAQDQVVAYYKGIRVTKVTRLVETLTCFAGIEDQHARIGVQLVNGQVNHFSFYSKSKPRACSIDVKRDGPYSHWEDNGVISKVTLMEEKGVFLIDRKSGGYRFWFRGVDRVRYCGMDGKINGSLTVMRGKSKCDVQGIMDGHQG